MKLHIIAAVAQNGVIGKDGSIPWHLPEDLKRFSRLTKGDGKNAVIMGRKTWESLPEKYRPLPGRFNIVVSSDVFLCDGAGPDARRVPCLREALRLTDHLEDVWLIGGQRIYEEAMAKYGGVQGMLDTPEYRVDSICLTLVHQTFDGDTFFPYFDANAESSPFRHVGGSFIEGDLSHTFMRYERKGQ